MGHLPGYTYWLWAKSNNFNPIHRRPLCHSIWRSLIGRITASSLPRMKYPGYDPIVTACGRPIAFFEMENITSTFPPPLKTPPFTEEDLRSEWPLQTVQPGLLSPNLRQLKACAALTQMSLSPKMGKPICTGRQEIFMAPSSKKIWLNSIQRYSR